MDLHNNIDVRPVIPPAVVGDNTPQVGNIIDHVNYEDAEYVIVAGGLYDVAATFTTLLEESDDPGMAGATAVADADLIGTEAAASFDQADDDACFKLGYKGRKRYTRLTITPAGNAADSSLAAVCILAGARKGPSANPPA